MEKKHFYTLEELRSEECVKEFGRKLYSLDLGIWYKSTRYDDRSYSGTVLNLGRGKPYLECLNICSCFKYDYDITVGKRPPRSYVNYGNNGYSVNCITINLYPLGK